MGAGWATWADLGSTAVTTVTSSDRGDTGSTRSQRGARSNPSDIPGQRAAGTSGGQTVRILVLGAGEAADELRRQASEAGAELAQRFSARVTHVVVEPELAADDPRVAKALAADLPVLTLAECVQLLGFGEPVDVGPAMIPAQPVTEMSTGMEMSSVTPVTPGMPGMPGMPDVPGVPVPSELERVVAPAELQLASEMQLADDVLVAEVPVGDVLVAEVLAVEVLAEVGDERGGAEVEEVAATLTAPAEPETVESTVDDAASDDLDADVETEVDDFADEAASCLLAEAPAPYSPTESMLGSALEAALLFPPLPVSPGDSLDSEAEYQIGFYAAEGSTRGSGAGEAGLAEGVGASAELVEESDECDACGEYGGTGAGLMSSGKAAALEAGGDEDEDEDGDEEDVEDEDEGLDVEVSDLSVGAVGAGSDRARTIASYAWAAVPFASLGLLTPIAMGYAAYRQRSRALAAVTAWYLLAISIAFVVSAAASGGTQPQSAVGDLLTICLAASWIGGTAHALLIRRQVFGKSE